MIFHIIYIMNRSKIERKLIEFVDSNLMQCSHDVQSGDSRGWQGKLQPLMVRLPTSFSFHASSSPPNISNEILLPPQIMPKPSFSLSVLPLQPQFHRLFYFRYYIQQEPLIDFLTYWTSNLQSKAKKIR